MLLARAADSPAVQVTASPAGVVITTPAARFTVLPSGYIKGALLEDGAALTLDQPGVTPGDTFHSMTRQRLAEAAVAASESAAQETRASGQYNVAHAKVSEVEGKLGAHGKRIEVSAPAGGVAGYLGRTLAVEVYDDFPNLALATVEYVNSGQRPVTLRQVELQSHRFGDTGSRAARQQTGHGAAPAPVKAAVPYRVWSFQGASEKWGNDDVLKLPAGFHRDNVMGIQNARGEGGGVPVVAFWNRSVGEAIGHIETVPLVLALPVSVGADRHIHTAVTVQPNVTLAPGERYVTPRSFLAVFSGDFYAPLRLYSSVLQREGWTLPKPSAEAYNVSWCGWGYEFNVTPAQMLGTIPKLKEFNIRWATLDDRWFDRYGDWNPRPDTFPGDSIRKMVDAFHKQGIYLQIWWLPLGAEDGGGNYEGHQYVTADVVKQHPEWLILGKDGKPVHMVRHLAALCPALPEVQQYYRDLAKKFIHDWDFDGHKLDNVFTVPACYNPAHHHKSPHDSITAMGEVFKAIFETTRALKPQSITQSCPCGTPPNIAWLPYMDQAVTADPVGSVQVRRRLKMYKALLGPEAAVYGDHVELTKIRYDKAGNEHDLGSDFASTVGVGGVVGTKFVWPDPGPHFAEVLLTPERERSWKKWIDIYNSKMLSKGDFKNLYTYGYDVPEGYAIAKDGKMYYAFFAPEASAGHDENNASWAGQIELRGLAPGHYRVTDYEHDKDLGTVDTSQPRLAARFRHHLLLEVAAVH